jgi:predicted Zn-dependent peptidase
VSSSAARIEAVTVDDVAQVAAARLLPSNRVVGRFEPLPLQHRVESISAQAAR